MKIRDITEAPDSSSAVNSIFGKQIDDIKDAEAEREYQRQYGSGATPSGNNTDTTNPSQPVTGTSSGRIRYANQGKIRNMPLHPNLEALLQRTAAEVGVDVIISSGGQMSLEAYRRARGEKSNSGGSSPTYYLNRRAVRKGSTRHDNGMAADIQIRNNGRNLKLDSPLMNSFIEAFFRNPGAGGGSGDRDYMGDETIHVDIHASRARTWNATPQFIAAMNRGLSSRGTA